MNQMVELAQPKGRERRQLRVTMLGLRGFPDVQGGVEKHVEKLAPALAELGCEVEAIVRSPYVEKSPSTVWRGVSLTRLWAPRVSGVEAFVHTFLGVLHAGVCRPDILHIHAIGPAFFTPFARALGLRVVVTHHVLNYENEKWGAFARSLLRFGEWAGMAFANGRIAVSEGLAKHVTRAYRVPVSAIPNGIDQPCVVESTAALQAFGLEPKRYALTVARIDAQKRPLDLIAAYAALREPSWKLALVGGADYSGDYAQAVAAAANNTPGVVLLGHQTGTALAELYSHAGAFVLPSSHEGQPISVLEAASFGLPLVLSDIAAHRELALAHVRYFPVGDCQALAACLAETIEAPTARRPSAAEQAALIARHDWRSIAQRTLAVYFDARSEASKRRPAGASRPAKTSELS